MINIAQLGCGYWGLNLLRNAVSAPRCTVKCVCDPSEDRRHFVKSMYPGIATLSDCEEVIADPEINALIIATPSATHYDLTVRSLESGKHVLVEKPMAFTIEEVVHIKDLAVENKLIAMVGHTFLYNSAVVRLKEFIRSGELGAIRYIFSQRLNLGRIRSDVDALWNFAPHDVSIIQYLLDNPNPVAIERIGMDYVQPGIEDVVFLNIIYPEKIMANIHVSWLNPQKVRQMTVVGEKKMAVYDDLSENKITIFDKGIDRMAELGRDMDFDSSDFFRFTHRSGDILMPKIDFQEPLKVEIEHFLDCITGQAKCLTDANHALTVIRILNTETNLKWKTDHVKENPLGRSQSPVSTI